MTTPKTYRLATPEEMERINREADEAELLCFENGLADEPLIVVAPGRSETAESQKGHGKESQEKTHAGLESQELSESQDL